MKNLKNVGRVTHKQFRLIKKDIDINNRSNKAITLISLVITIVVLIILAGVAINLTLGDNGIFNKAKLAKEQYNMAAIKEKLDIAILEIQADEVSEARNLTLDTLLTKLPTKLEGIEITKEGNTLKGTYDGYDFVIGENFEVTIEGYNPSEGEGEGEGGGSEPQPPVATTYNVTFNASNVTSNGAATVNENEAYTATLTLAQGYRIKALTVKMGETTLEENTGYTLENNVLTIANVSGNLEITVTSIQLQAGDYIKYNTGKPEIGDNGVVLCRVLYNDAEHGLQIITDKNITKKVDGVDTEIQVTLEGSDWEIGKTAYNSAIETLNNATEGYLNPTYAYDARCVGSAPTVENGMFVNKDKIKLEGTEQYVVKENTTTVSIPDDFTLPTGWETRDTECYNTDTNYTDDETAMKAEGVGIWTTGEVYWLASHLVVSESSDCYFRVRHVGTSGGLSYGSLCRVSGSGSTGGHSSTSGLRPCFSLKSDIKVTGEDGKTPETAYVIE